MEKFNAGTKTCGFGFSTGSVNCPFDMAEHLMDWNDGLRTSDIYEIVDDIFSAGGLNDFGVRMYARITSKFFGAPWKGFGLTKGKRELLVKEHEEWRQKSGIVDGDGGESKRDITKIKIESEMEIPKISDWRYDNKENMLKCYHEYIKDMLDGNDLTQVVTFYKWCDHEYYTRFRHKCSECESLNVNDGLCSDCSGKSLYKKEWDKVVEKNDWAQEIFPIKKIVVKNE